MVLWLEGGSDQGCLREWAECVEGAENREEGGASSWCPSVMGVAH